MQSRQILECDYACILKIRKIRLKNQMIFLGLCTQNEGQSEVKTELDGCLWLSFHNIHEPTPVPMNLERLY